MSKYIRPNGIDGTMGSSATGEVNRRILDIFDLLECAPNNLQSVLDVGFGQGEISKWFANKGASVTAIGLELESYDLDLLELSKSGVSVIEANVEQMPFESNTFDAVVASHVFEHVYNLGQALSETRRVLKENGWLFVFLPRYTNYVLAGHVNIGWNIGQLMYVLLLNGYNIKDGQFIEYRGNLCAFVQKSFAQLPALRGDRGDIHILNSYKLWPVPVKNKDGIADNFDGNISAVNWKKTELLNDKTQFHTKRRILRRIVGLLKKVLGVNLCFVIGEALLSPVTKINPKELD